MNVSVDNCVPDKNAEVHCVNSNVEHGIGNQAEVRNDYDTVERADEEHKDASIKHEGKVHALNIVTRKLDTNCEKGEILTLQKDQIQNPQIQTMGKPRWHSSKHN